MPRIRRPGVVSLVCAAAAVSAGCAGARESAAPLARTDWVAAGGLAAMSAEPSGLGLRFIERGRFGMGIVLRNRSRLPVTVVDVATSQPASSLIHQIGTRLVPWDPPPCPTNARGCPGLSFLRPPYAAVRPVAVSVAPGETVAVQLNYQLGICGVELPGSSTSAHLLDVAYRYGKGTVRHETLELGSASLLLRAPMPADCQRRPRSRIALDGPFATSSDWTIPGKADGTCMRTTTGKLVCSDGDRCTRTAAGGLLFRSGLFQAPGAPAIRVEIRLPRFSGAGLYRTLRTPAPALGAAQVLVTAGIGLHGWTTFAAHTSVVTVTQGAGTTLGGRFHASLTARKTHFRAHGVWRCTTRQN